MREITQNQLTDILLDFNSRVDQINPVCTAFFDTLYKTGCRPAELFLKKKWNIKDFESYELTPLKRNNKRKINKELLNDDFVDFIFNENTEIPEISEKYLQRWFNIIMKRSFFVNSKPVTLYMYRYRFISDLFINPVDSEPQNVKTGHQTLAMTQRYYQSKIMEL